MKRLHHLIVTLLLGLSLSNTVISDPSPESFNYFVLTPQFGESQVEVMSLENRNLISPENLGLHLEQYETGVVPGGDLFQGAILSGAGPFSIASDQAFSNLPVPENFAGDAFVLPQMGGSDVYSITSPYRDVLIDFDAGRTIQELYVYKGDLIELYAGSRNTRSGIIRSDGDILVAHYRENNFGALQASYPVPPAATELWGIQSERVILSALEDATRSVVYSSDGVVSHYALDAGEQVWLAATPGASQDFPRGLHILADRPVSATHTEDVTFSTTGFWRTVDLRKRYGFPVETQEIIVVCPYGNSTVTLYEEAPFQETAQCGAEGPFPGMLFFSTGDDPEGIQAGSYLEADQPVYVAYRSRATNELRNLFGAGTAEEEAVSAPEARAGSVPSLDPPVSPTNDNPYAITGSADPGDTIFIYVNGEHQKTAVADAGGLLSVSVALLDGVNSIYATSWDGAVESGASNTVFVDYVNTISRTQGGNISQDTVWTAGADGPYNITSDLTVAAGIEFVIQPGVELSFDNGTTLQVDGTLLVQGTAGSPVRFTSAAASPQAGDWDGIRITVISAFLTPTAAAKFCDRRRWEGSKGSAVFC